MDQSSTRHRATPKATAEAVTHTATSQHRRRAIGLRLLRALITISVVSTSLVLAVSPALAVSGAEYTTVQDGSRGEDVRAVQYLLNHHGFVTTVDGVFGPTTETKVKAFQSANGQTADGIVGPSTWGALTVSVSQGSTGNAVRAVQALLNGKRDPTSPDWGLLTVDGVFGSGTKAVVQSFQSHSGLTSDGIVGSGTWKNLVWHYVVARSTSYICGAAGQPASESWGTAASVEAIRRAGIYFNSQGTGDLPFWDFSKEHGGSLSPHATHQRGMDADIGLISTNDNQCNSGSGSGGRGMYYWDTTYYDEAKTIAMVDDLVAASGGWIEKAYFNDDDVNTRYAFMTSLSSHDHHLHFRWCVKYYPSSTTPGYSYPSDGNYDC